MLLFPLKQAALAPFPHLSRIFMQAQENSLKPQTKYGLSHTEFQAQLHNTKQTH